MCRCNLWATQACRFVFMWFQPANPDQTVILIGEKHPSVTFKYLCSQLLSMTDRQQYVKRASFGIMYSFALYLCKTNNRSPDFFFHVFLACFFFFLIQRCCPLTGLQGSHFFRSRTCLSECIFKGPGKAWHYTCSCCASWRGIPSGTLSSGHVNCLFAYWIAPGVVLSSSENKQLITSLGQSGNLYANQENSQGLTIM